MITEHPADFDQIIRASDPDVILEVLMAELASRCRPANEAASLSVQYRVDFGAFQRDCLLRIKSETVDITMCSIDESSLTVLVSVQELCAGLFAAPERSPSMLGVLAGDASLYEDFHACFPEPRDLTELAMFYGSDKWGMHRYTPHYEFHLGGHRDRAVRLLEIGVGGHRDPYSGGASLRMWEEYFPRGLIYGVDIFDKRPLNRGRVRTFQGHQADHGFLDTLLSETGELDIVIDDGSHINSHVIASFCSIFPHLRDGGLYVVEDVQTSYWPGYGGSSVELNDPSASMGFFKAMVDGLNYEEYIGIDYRPTYTDLKIVNISFYHNLIFVRKGDNREGTFPANRPRIPTVDIPVPQGGNS
ncbi:hypothetical protein ACFPIJ_21715 [Dactylosporangium cerinum]|uniref:Uncharacterized protein n=1 Tax=Dactylosporangium cerinum TaxID=1434730 RepID=A0ABV9VVM7_9ACTN